MKIKKLKKYADLSSKLWYNTIKFLLILCVSLGKTRGDAMEKISIKKTGIMEKKDSNKRSYYDIKVRTKGNGYEARMTLNIVGDGINPRITAYGETIEGSVIKILVKVKDRLIEYKKINLIEDDKALEIHSSIVQSIKRLKISDNRILEEISSIFKVLTYKNNILQSATIIGSETKRIIEENEMKDNFSVEKLMLSAEMKPIKSKGFESVGCEWFKYRYEFTKKTAENVNPLSPKTVDGYYKILVNQLIPYFKGNKNITTLTANDYKKCILSFDGFRNQESVYIVLNMILKYAKKQKYIFFVPEIKKPEEPRKCEEDEIICIVTERQSLWLDKFEENESDITLLFEILLLEGLRPEERLWT